MRESLKTHYERDGYIVLENVFTQEQCGNLKKEVKRILDEVANRVEWESNETTGDNDPRKNGVFVGLAQNSAVFHELARNETVVDALKQLIGEDIQFLSDKVVFKNASTDFGSPWHQDWPYWKGSHKVSVWIALDPATPVNGCLKVVPGSHKKQIEHNGDAADGKGFTNRIRPDSINESEVKPLPVQAGSAVIFHDLLLHASYANTSGKDRWAIISTYKDNTLEDPVYDWAGAAFDVT